MKLSPPPQRRIIFVGFLPDNNGRNPYALHLSGTVINQDTSSIGEAQEKVRIAALVWIGPDNIHGFVDGALDKWAMIGEFGIVQKWWVGITADCLFYCYRR